MGGNSWKTRWPTDDRNSVQLVEIGEAREGERGGGDRSRVRHVEWAQEADSRCPREFIADQVYLRKRDHLIVRSNSRAMFEIEAFAEALIYSTSPLNV